VNGKRLDRMNPLPAEEPLRGLGIGERLAWLNRETEWLRGKRPAEEERPVDEAACDFCGQVAEVAVSEQGPWTAERPEVARICAPCAAWAIRVLSKMRTA
jgi:hypothetical protein